MQRDHQQLGSILQQLPRQPEQAFQALYQDYYKMMFGIAYSVLKNETQSQDVVQNVMLKLLELPKERLPSAGELSWLYRVTKNEAIQLLRGEKSGPSLEEIDQIPVDNGGIDQLVDKDVCQTLLKAVDETSRDIIAMKAISGLTHKEIGKVLKLPTGTVQWKYHQSIHKLQLLAANMILFGLSVSSVLLCKVQLSKIPDVMRIGPEPFLSTLLTILIGIFFILVLVFGLGTVFSFKNFFKKPTK